MYKNIKLKNGNILIYPYNKNIKNLLTFSSRNNYNRKYIFISKVLGKYIPTKIKIMQQIYQELAKKLPNDNISTLIIGFAETATALGYGIFMEYKNKNSYYITTTRYNFNKNLLFDFSEEHSHAKQHFIYKPKIKLNKIERIILIDDEITTGKTANNLLNKLNLPNLKEKILVSLINWKKNIKNFDKIITLYKGNFQFKENKKIIIKANKSINTKFIKQDKLLKEKSERFGITKKETLKELKNFYIPNINNKKILIIGNGEYMYFPYLIGEKLSKKNNVEMLSIARSPIKKDLGIKNIIKIKDSYNENIDNFIYNFNPYKYDYIIVFFENKKFNNNIKKILNKIKHKNLYYYLDKKYYKN